MNSGSAPQTTRSSTTMPTRSMPIVSCLSSACAMATLVPTPSVDVASSGWRYVPASQASNSPAKPPMPPTTSGRAALRDPRLHQLDGALARLDVDAGSGVATPRSRVPQGVGAAPAAEERSDRLRLLVASLGHGAGQPLQSSRCLPSSSGSGSAIG